MSTQGYGQILARDNRIQKGCGSTDPIAFFVDVKLEQACAIFLAFTVVVPIGAVVSDFDRALAGRALSA